MKTIPTLAQLRSGGKRALAAALAAIEAQAGSDAAAELLDAACAAPRAHVIYSRRQRIRVARAQHRFHDVIHIHRIAELCSIAEDFQGMSK